MASNYDMSVVPLSFPNADFITEVVFTKTGITDLHEHDFVTLPGLISLKVNESALTNVDPHAFVGLINLQELDLGNLITKPVRKFFCFYTCMLSFFAKKISSMRVLRKV